VNCFQGDRPVSAAMTTKSTDAEHPRKHRHSADRERGRGRPVHHHDGVAGHPPPSITVPRSPSPPIQSNKHRRPTDSKERGRPDSYVMKYQKFQHQAYSPRGQTEPHRTEHQPRIRPCIKYHAETVPPCRMEASLLGEQAVTDIEPPLGDDDLYLDSLEDYEISRDDVIQQTDAVTQDLPATETNEYSTDQPDIEVPATDPTAAITECVPSEEAGLQEPVDAGPVEDTGSVDTVDQELATETSVQELSPDVAADRDISGQSEDDEV